MLQFLKAESRKIDYDDDDADDGDDAMLSLLYRTKTAREAELACVCERENKRGCWELMDVIQLIIAIS